MARVFFPRARWRTMNVSCVMLPTTTCYFCHCSRQFIHVSHKLLQSNENTSVDVKVLIKINVLHAPSFTFSLYCARRTVFATICVRRRQNAFDEVDGNVRRRIFSTIVLSLRNWIVAVCCCYFYFFLLTSSTTRFFARIFFACLLVMCEFKHDLLA